VNLSVIEAPVIAGYPKWFSRYSQETKVEVIPLRERLAGSARLPLMALLIAVGIVLLIGCINVANLQLTRVAARQREMAVRAALGAGTRRLACQLLTESGLLAFVGGAVGVVWAFWGIRVLCDSVPKSILAVGLEDVHMNASILMFALVLTVSSGILVGLAPGMAAVRPDLNQAMKAGGGRQGFGAGQTLFRNLLMAGEIFATVVLLTAAGLFLKSFVRLSEVHPGFSPQGILTAQVSLSQRRYGEPERQAVFFQQVLDRAAALPGVRYAVVTDRLPPDGPEFGRRIALVGRPQPAPNDVLYSVVEIGVSPDYFRMLEIPLISGRTFTAGDSVHDVVVVNQAFVRRFFSDSGTALNQGVVAAGTAAPLSIVGVVGDARNVGLTAPAAPAMFRPFSQRPGPRMYIALKTEFDPAGAAAMLRQQILGIDKGQPLYAAETMQQILDEDTAASRFYMAMSGLMAALALLLASIGIYGVVSYGIAQRTREIGLRMALGAKRGDTAWLILRQGLPWILGGIVAGAGTALVGTRFLGGLLYSVKPADLWTLLAAICLLGLVVLAAFYVPARRAMRIDPVVALRQE
jgi:putative ABC transport system permease protein